MPPGHSRFQFLPHSANSTAGSAGLTAGASLPETILQATGRRLRIGLEIHVALWIVALLLAILHYRVVVANMPPDQQPLEEIWAVYTGAASPAHGATPCAAGQLECKIDSVAASLHPFQGGAANALAKSLIVVSLALLWFSTFTLIRRHGEWADARAGGPAPALQARWQLSHGWFKWSIIGTSILPAAIFVLAMAGAYEPAVFVMALAAIYVAAEHYAGLEKTRDDFEHGVTKLERHVGTLLNADGMDAWRTHLYEQYREATTRIDAVVRYFDIDREWWQCYAEDRPWPEYVRRAATQEGLFLNVLANPACRAKVQFVADLPMSMPTVRPRQDAFSNRQVMANYFRELMGLAWQLTVLAEVEQRRRAGMVLPCKEGFCYLRIKISSAPSWMHVIDDKTYQIIERQEMSQATVRELHLDIAGAPRRIRLSDWARRNVRNFAFRGTPGQEHLLSTLRSAALKAGSEADVLHGGFLESVLRKLGMEEYLVSGTHRDFVIVEARAEGSSAEPAFLPTRDSARKMCIATFDAFLCSVFPGKSDIQVADLAGALL